MSNQENKNQKAWLGVALVVFGAFFLLRNFNLMPYFIPHYLFGWEMIVIIIGGSMLVTGRKEGFIPLLIGGLFLAPDIFYLPHISIRDWWPVILIAIGVSIILRRRDHIRMQKDEINGDLINDTTIFGGSAILFTSQNFKGGKITSFFGGSEINLSQSQLSDDKAIIDLFCMFGGNTLIVPNDWTVINEGFAIFGGYADGRNKTSMVEKDPKKVLIMKGYVIFGGNEVKSA